jgi:hypothetical protein
VNPAEERAERDARRAAAWALISRDIAANLQSRPDADCDIPARTITQETTMQITAPDPITADDLAVLDYAETTDGTAWHRSSRDGMWYPSTDRLALTDHELADEEVTLAEHDAF